MGNYHKARNVEPTLFQHLSYDPSINKSVPPLSEEIFGISRLELLKEKKFLNKRIFRRVSENMHYEIFKYLNWKDLLQIRELKLGGYQLTANKLLRSRIKNHLTRITPTIAYTAHNDCRNFWWLKLIIEQSERNYISLHGIYISNQKEFLDEVFRMISDVRNLSLTGCSFEEDSNKKIIFGLKRLSRLRELKLQKNNFDWEVANVLGYTFRYITNLRILDFSHNPIYDTGANILIDNLPHLLYLNSLNLSSNKIGDSPIKNLALNFQYIPHLRKLYLGDNEFGKAGITALTKNFSFIRKLEILNLYQNKIGYTGGISELICSCKYLPKLKHLDLKQNQIRDQAVTIMLKELRSISHLELFNLSQNMFGPIKIGILQSHCGAYKINLII